jgi:hypothetical protein
MRKTAQSSKKRGEKKRIRKERRSKDADNYILQGLEIIKTNGLVLDRKGARRYVATLIIEAFPLLKKQRPRRSVGKTSRKRGREAKYGITTRIIMRVAKEHAIELAQRKKQRAISGEAGSAHISRYFWKRAVKVHQLVDSPACIKSLQDAVRVHLKERKKKLAEK